MRIHDSLHRQPNPKPLPARRKKGEKSFEEHLEENLVVIQDPPQLDRDYHSPKVNLQA
ncbi:MAG: hypothetical protein V3U37_05380 [Nitrospinaceae bacterium]